MYRPGVRPDVRIPCACLGCSDNNAVTSHLWIQSSRLWFRFEYSEDVKALFYLPSLPLTMPISSIDKYSFTRLWSSLPRPTTPYGKFVVSAVSVVGGVLYLQDSQTTPHHFQSSSTTPLSTSLSDDVVEKAWQLWDSVRHVSVDIIPPVVQNSKRSFIDWLSSAFEWPSSRRSRWPKNSGIDIEIQMLLEQPQLELPMDAAACIQSLIQTWMKHPEDDSPVGEALCAVAGSSIRNAHLLASHGIGDVIRSCLEDQSLRHRCDRVTRLVIALLENCPKVELLEMETWIRPLMCTLADGLSASNPTRVLSSVSMLEAVTRTNHRRIVQVLKRTPSLWTIIKRTAAMKDSRVQQQTVHLIRSLINGHNPSMHAQLYAFIVAGIGCTEEETEHFQHLLLQWIMDGPNDLRDAASAALTGTHPFYKQPSQLCVSADMKWLSGILMALSSHPNLISNAMNAAEPSVIPSYIRYVADEILGLPIADPPDHTDIHHYRSVEPLMLDWEEDHSEDTAISRGLSILNDFAADSSEISTWLVRMEILKLCWMLTRKKTHPLKEQQQIARLIAILARSHNDNRKFNHWLPWLKRRVDSSDLLLASNALRSVMHIQRGYGPGISFPDGIHFFQPKSQMADQLTMKERLQGDTVMDVVFVHGIRGGPFITWRMEDSSDTHSTRDSCWPSDWLTHDVPSAQLITVEFAAPVSSWEGGSGPLKETAQAVLMKLREAGIGDRPLVFVAHSMGGIIVKEMFVRALDSDASSWVNNIQGMIFISTPHHGTWLAHLAWGLRHVGACPAPSLNTMKPGPYLENLDKRMKEWVQQRRLPVLNFAETRSTNVLAVIPKVHVVPPSSAFPGYGRSIALTNRNHITSCKPKNKTDVFYRNILAFLNFIMNRQ